MTAVDRIPIQNIYYLLLYAWQRLEENDVVDVQPEEATRLLDLFARVLIGGSRLLLKRGLDRGYILYREDLRGIRGKIDFSETVKRQLMVNAMICCEYDDLSYDVLHNRILRTTISALARSRNVDKEQRSELADIERRLREIDTIRLSADLFLRVQLHRNNAFYGFLMDVCEMIYRYHLVSEEPGDGSFREFLRDRDKMPKVFEDFVRNFYKMELEGRYPGYRVKGAETIKWDVTDPDAENARFLPDMVTDISIRTPQGYLVIDTKYYYEALKGQYDPKVISVNLYQLFAYLKNLEKRGAGYQSCTGILLYPAVQQDLDLNYEIQGHQISIRTIDLNKDWPNIHSKLLTVVGVSNKW